jgi:hypothetical protein
MTGEGYERAESVLSRNRVTRLSAKAPFDGHAEKSYVVDFSLYSIEIGK